MNPAALPTWLNAVLVFLLFVVAPSTAHLLGPFETDAIQAVADIDESLAAMFAASKGEK